MMMSLHASCAMMICIAIFKNDVIVLEGSPEESSHFFLFFFNAFFCSLDGTEKDSVWKNLDLPAECD